MKMCDFVAEHSEEPIEPTNPKNAFTIDIENKTLENENFREELFTANHMQLTVMTLQPGENIGSEVHDVGDQFIRIEAGSGEFVLNGESKSCADGDIAMIPAGVEHDVVNTGEEALKLYSIYAPPEHQPGTIHATKQDDDEH